MTVQYGFFFDSRFCSGCKACQAACKDKNNLPPGVLLRRVMEVSGGTWLKAGTAWNNSVFAYNLSISCNHCVHPKCARICPTNAFRIREDGIVILDESKCMGCGYCAWGCPYGAPQFNPEAGHMTKCDFCFDNLEQGLPPACVAACPLRVLDYGDIARLPEPSNSEIRLWEAPSDTHPYPLPSFSHTQPRLAIKQHKAINTTGEKHIANMEEIQPRSPSIWEEVPLLLFSLLGQMAVGSVWAMIWMFSTLWALVEYDAMVLRLLPVLFIGGCLGIGMIASLMHLGTKKNAWRVFSNLRYSSLSQEVLYTGLFLLSLLFVIISTLMRQNITLITTLAGVIGLKLVLTMARVYRLPAALGWNTWRTNAGFLVSAILLGLAAMTPLLAYESSLTSLQIPHRQWAVIGIFILALLLSQGTITPKRTDLASLQNNRLGLILIGVALAVVISFRPGVDFLLTSTLLSVFVISEEVLGRCLFYRSRI